MTILQAIYELLTDKARAKNEESRKAKENTIVRLYHENTKNGRRSKLDYALMCKSMKRNNEFHALLIQRKTAKWEWLRKLI